MSIQSVTWMPVPAPRGYLVNPYKQGDTMTEFSAYESVQVFIGVLFIVLYKNVIIACGQGYEYE